MTQMSGPTQTIFAGEQLNSRSQGIAMLGDLFAMTKPRIAALVAVTTYLGYLMAPPLIGEPMAMPTWVVLSLLMIGTGVASMGSSVLNQVVERDVDGLMPRTQKRPLVTGKVSPGLAVAFGLLLAIIGVGMVAALPSPLAAGLTAFTVISYVLAYTPLKRVTSLSTIVGAVPGALPPVIGYAAVTGDIGPTAWVMFAIMFVWQLPHFLAIAWLYREDYAAAKMPMLPVVDPTGSSTFRQMLICCLILIPLSLMPTLMGAAGMIYFWTALVASIAFGACGVQLMLNPVRANAKRMFWASLIHLPSLLAVMVLDRM